MSRRIEDLVPEMQVKIREFAGLMAEAAIPWMITRTRSTLAEQEAIHAQGRKPLIEVNRLRALVKWMPIRESENRIVTWTMKSMHTSHLAFDIAIIKDGKPCWDLKVSVNDNDLPDYLEAGQIGEEFGLTWGGRWKSPDPVHFQLAMGGMP